MARENNNDRYMSIWMSFFSGTFHCAMRTPEYRWSETDSMWSMASLDALLVHHVMLVCHQNQSLSHSSLVHKHRVWWSSPTNIQVCITINHLWTIDNIPLYLVEHSSCMLLLSHGHLEMIPLTNHKSSDVRVRSEKIKTSRIIKLVTSENTNISRHIILSIYTIYICIYII